MRNKNYFILKSRYKDLYNGMVFEGFDLLTKEELDKAKVWCSSHLEYSPVFDISYTGKVLVHCCAKDVLDEINNAVALSQKEYSALYNTVGKSFGAPTRFIMLQTDSCHEKGEWE